MKDKAETVETQDQASLRWYGLHKFEEDGDGTCRRRELASSSSVHAVVDLAIPADAPADAERARQSGAQG